MKGAIGRMKNEDSNLSVRSVLMSIAVVLVLLTLIALVVINSASMEALNL
jgi:signal peptidase I